MSLVSATLRHRRWLIAYENGAVKEAIATYDQKVSPIMARLEKIQDRIDRGLPLTARQRKQAARDRARLQRLIRSARDDVRDSLQTRLEDVAGVELRVSVRNLSAGLPKGVTARAPAVDLRTLALNPTAGRSWPRRVDASMIPTFEKIDAALAISIDRGASMPRAAELVQLAIDTPYTQRKAIRRLVRTEIQRVANEAAQATYRENRDVVHSVRYLATLDSRVCSVCRPFHNDVFPMDEDGNHAGPRLPQHPNCRCFYAPVTRSIAEIIAGAA